MGETMNRRIPDLGHSSAHSSKAVEGYSNTKVLNYDLVEYRVSWQFYRSRYALLIRSVFSDRSVLSSSYEPKTHMIHESNNPELPAYRSKFRSLAIYQSLRCGSPNSMIQPLDTHNTVFHSHLRTFSWYSIAFFLFFSAFAFAICFFCFFSLSPALFGHPKVTHVPISQDLRSVTERSSAVTSVSVPEYVFAAPVRHGSSSSRYLDLQPPARQLGIISLEKSRAILVAYVG